MSKERAFREYLVESELANQVTSLFYAIIKTPSLAHSPTILTDFFGYIRSPIWDEIEALRTWNEQLRTNNGVLESQLSQLLVEREALLRSQVAAALWSLITASYKAKDKKDEASRKTVLLTLNGVEGKKCLPEIHALVPEVVRQAEITALLHRSVRAAEIARGWLDRAGDKAGVWGNVASEELKEFWNQY